MKYEAASLRTKQQLAESLKKLMRTKPFNRITVTELVADCGLNRKTFYYHFEDIYALVRWMFQEEAISLLKQREGSILWQEGLLQLFYYLEENRAVCLCALRSPGHDALKHFFGTNLEAIFGKEVEDIRNIILKQ